MLDLTRPEHAYRFGFIQGDGHVGAGPGRNGTVSIELGLRDEVHLRALAAVLPARAYLSRRVRRTNFRAGHESAILAVHDLTFREALAGLGLGAGPKSRTARRYNLMLAGEPAQLVVAERYRHACLALPRKAERADALLAWRRDPPGHPWRRWTEEDGRTLAELDDIDAAAMLGRSPDAVAIRRRTLARRSAQRQD